MKIEEFPRTAVDQWLRLVRLPLTAVEGVARRGKDNAEWPPAVAFERVESTVRQLVGSLVGDEELVQKAQLQRAKADELAKAAQERAKAEQRKQAADAGLAQREKQADKAKDRVEREEQQQKAQVEQQRKQAEHQVQKQTAKRKEAARKTDQARKKVVAAADNKAERRRVDAEADALSKEEQALQAKRVSMALEDAVEATKAVRKDT